MSNLSIYITTFNTARTLPSLTHLASALFSDPPTPSPIPPDLIVLCLQELAPLGYSFLGAAYLTPYFSRLSNVVQRAVAARFEDGVEYETLLAQNVGMTGLMVFVRRDVRERVRWIETAGVGVGVWEMGNKGAVGARLGVVGEDEEVVPVTFVSAHLAAGEGEVERRNEDWKSICEGLVFTREVSSPSQDTSMEESAPLLGEASSPSSKDPTTSSSSISSLFSPPSHIFLAGDLNYRTSSTSPRPSDHQTWPSPLSATHTFQSLLASDQLTRERLAHRTLHNLTESLVTFNPTYKYSASAQAHPAAQSVGKGSKPEEPGSDAWARHRVPSWCDRILYLPSSNPRIASYTALPVQPSSDHRPVALAFSIELEPAVGAEAPFKVKKDWNERRAVARRLEVIVGLAAYLGWTWEGEALLVATVVGIVGVGLVVRALIGS
ncbi:hypothetical protein B0A48_17647 [Cryoendolithus antarcticus]|uniref:Inositol polyphosphate-related phosphatase domain-containing protein n=1 Tax=Cryoendolithus antarcticus TaxID=1507870 RepID=A0A1V8SB50_9PEZI|nr:hypothetical protein B0A48_17647 [Cryoendolithus antarcticus]